MYEKNYECLAGFNTRLRGEVESYKVEGRKVEGRKVEGLKVENFKVGSRRSDALQDAKCGKCASQLVKIEEFNVQ